MILIFGEKRVGKIKSKKNSKNLESNLDVQKVTLIKKFCLDLEKPPYLTKSPCSFKTSDLVSKSGRLILIWEGVLIIKMHVIKKFLKPHFITQHLLIYLKDHYLDSLTFKKLLKIRLFIGYHRSWSIMITNYRFVSLNRPHHLLSSATTYSQTINLGRAPPTFELFCILSRLGQIRTFNRIPYQTST